MWVWDNTRSQFILMMIWSGIDRVGPLAVAKMLFKAYRASALTQDIDPFTVHVRSNKEVLAARMNDAIATGADEYQLLRKDREHPDEFLYQWAKPWIYTLSEKRRSAVDTSRDWKRFSGNIEKLAA